VAGSIGSIDIQKIWQSYSKASTKHIDKDSFFVGPRKADYYGRGYGSNGTAYSYYLRLNIISSSDEDIVIQFDIPDDFLRTALAQDPTGMISSLRLILGHTTFASWGSLSADSPPDIVQNIGETGFQIQAQLQWPPKDFQKTEVAVLAIVISLITLLYTFTISMVLGRSFAKPMVTMSSQLHRITRSDSEGVVSVPKVPELSLLARDINTMLSGIRELHREVLFRERSQHEAEMKALQAQINPHFLFNSLETFRGLALAGETKKAADAVKSLAKILRYTIRGGGYESGLNDEIEAVENYLKIQKLRFGERIDSHISLHGEASSVKVPRLILQPLVENVFVHAVDDSQSTVRLYIDIHITSSRATITIQDNGKGISGPELKQIQHRLESVKEEYRATKIIEIHGLMNVQQRLHLAYGMHSGLRISSVPWNETKVTLELVRTSEKA
jgi:sensor histidine kinase YesM